MTSLIMQFVLLTLLLLTNGQDYMGGMGDMMGMGMDGMGGMGGPQGPTPGVIQLDGYSFPKIVDGSHAVIVKFDDQYSFGEAEDVKLILRIFRNVTRH